MMRILINIYKHRTYVKYIISGGTAAAVQFFFLYFLHDVFSFNIIFSTSVGFVFAFLVSFTLHKFWTFRDNNRQGMYLQASSFFMAGIANLVINAYAMYFLVEKLEVWYIFSQVIVSGSLAFSNFLFLRFVIFRRKFKKNEKTEPQGANNILLIATGIYPPDIGGPAGYVRKLQKQLPSSDFLVKVVTYSDKAGDEKDVIRIERKNIIKRYYEYFLAVCRELEQARMVYVQDAVSAGLPAAFACYLNRREFVLKIVGDHSWEQGKQRFKVTEMIDDFQGLSLEDVRKKYKLRLYLMRYIQFLVARQAKKIIVPSRYLKGIVLKWGVPAEKIEVVYNAASKLPSDLWSREKAREEYGLGGFVILSAGRLVPWKGFGDLIEVFSALTLIEEDINLVIVGSGPLEHELKRKVNYAGLADHVQFTGKLPQEELWQYMRAADVFVLNTGYEGLSHVIIEAMKNGLPVIATDVGGNPEIITNGKNGLLVKYKDQAGIMDAITKLSDENERKKITEEALASLGQFEDEAMIAKTVEILKDLVPGNDQQ